MNYADFVLRASDWNAGSFNVLVSQTPDLSQMPQPEQVQVDTEALNKLLTKVVRKSLSPKQFQELGKQLSRLLLPPAVRAMLMYSLAQLEPDEGLRLRLVLTDPQIANVPWEFINLPRAGDEQGLDGFLGLDPRFSIVRHEAIPVPAGPVQPTARPLRVLAGFASPLIYDELDLETERNVIQSALGSLEHVELVDFIDHVTLDKLEKALHNIDIFHFAGHGTYDVPEASHTIPDERNYGAIVLENDMGEPDLFAAEKLATTLRAGNVKVAVLGACESGRRGERNTWNGIAPALMKSGIPAVVGMQYEVYDDSALAFATGFYNALSAGLNLDEAVLKGRINIINLHGKTSVDWGVPTLYMRSPDGVLFSPPEAEEQRIEMRKALEGEIIGQEIDFFADGELDTNIEMDKLPEGVRKVIGNKIKEMRGGKSTVNMKIGTVGKGETVIGAQLGGDKGT